MNIFNGYLAHSEREEVLRFAVFGEHPFVIHARMSPLLWLCSPSGCVSVHHNCYRLTDSVSLILGRIWILIVGLETKPRSFVRLIVLPCRFHVWLAYRLLSKYLH